jgi:hypothetical protein
MGLITATSQRAKLVDLSLGLMPSSIRVIVRKPNPSGFDFFFFFETIRKYPMVGYTSDNTIYDTNTMTSRNAPRQQWNTASD